jgi:hypothetical protein
MDAVLKFEDDKLVEAMESFMSLTPSAKTHFNCAQIAMILNDAQEAVNPYHSDSPIYMCH